MRSVLPILLAAVLAMAGSPHLLCPCGCSWIGHGKSDVAMGSSTTSCPYCSGRQTQDDGEKAPPAGPRPCRCRPCGERLAVVDRSAESGGFDSSDTWQSLVDVPLSLPLVAPEAISPRIDATAFPFFALPVRALCILLGHLLL